MRSQTPPFLLKKYENCRKIIKAPLHVHETFGTIHTIQYHCIKYCSRRRRRGYYNGLNREALPERGTFFRLQVHGREGFFTVEVYERDICHFSQLKDQNEISHRRILWMSKTRKPVLAIYSYCKHGVFKAVEKGCSVQKGYHLSLKGIQKGYLFCLKWYIQRVTGWSLGRSLFV